MHKPISINKIAAFFFVLFAFYGFTSKVLEKRPIFKDFEKKEYFKLIFDANEQSKIKDFKRQILKLETGEKKALVFLQEADKQARIAKVTQSAKTKKKALKKQSKAQKKADKIFLKLLPNVYSNYEQLALVYSKKFPSVKPKADSAYYQFAQKLQQSADIDINLAKNSYTFSKNLENNKKVDELLKIRKAMQEAISTYEYAFAALMGDSLVKLPIGEENNVNNSKTENGTNNNLAEVQKKEKSNIVTVNGSVYVSFEEKILSRLNLTAQEKKQVEASKQLERKADLINETVETWYTDIDRYRALANAATNTQQKDSLKRKADELESRSFAKLIEATEIYLIVNQSKFDIYKKYLEQLEFKSESQKFKVDLLKMEANTLLSIADTKMKLSKRLSFISEKYIKLMEANELELLAIEKQELAFLFYYAIPESSATVIAKSEETVTPIEEQLESTVEKPAANQKEFPRTYNYSVLKQSQVDVFSLTSDFLYRIQVGAFKRFPSVTLAKKYKLSSKKLKYKDLNVYYIGDFKTFEAINYALDEVRAHGYKDAFIICYVNGKLCSPAQAQNSVRKNKALYTKYLDAAKYELLGLKSGKSYYDIYAKPVVKEKKAPVVNKVKSNIEGQRGLAFYVQLGSFSKPVVPASLKAYMPLLVVKKKAGLYGIVKGPYNDYSGAQKYQKTIKAKGQKDAYIVAYKDGTHIELHKAINMQKKVVKEPAVVNNTSVAYRLQVAAYKGAIPSDLQKKLDVIAKTKPVEKFKQKSGVTIYTVGYFTNYKSASLAKNELKKYQINDSFVVAFRGNEKISLAEAKKN